MSDPGNVATPPTVKASPAGQKLPNLHERPASGGKHHGWIWVVVLLAVILAVVGIYVSHHRTSSAAASPSPRGGRGGMGAGPIMVSTTVAQTGDIGIYVTALGTVTPVNTVAITSRVQGQIMKVYYQEGQMVKAGDPLIDIDSGPDQAALLVAKGQLARDSALLEDSKLDLERYQEAFASNAIPKQQLDTQTATVHQNEGTVELDQGNLDSAQVQLAYCHIAAPISGRVGLRLVDAGNVVQAGSTNLVIITQLTPITVVFNVAEDNLPQIQKQLAAGNELDVDVFDRAQINKLASGTLQTLDNQIDPTTGTLRFKAIFTNEDNALFPNQFVNARLLVDTLEDVTLLPNTAIQRNSDTAFVYLLQSDKTGANQAGTNQTSANQTGTNQTATVKMQTITAGTTDGTVTEVEGIEPGTKVVADNFNKLSDGMKVVVRPANGTGHQKRKNASQ
jgi:multidrug efflux system membrane fusion protein